MPRPEIKIENKLRKGDYAIANVEHSAYHLHTGHYVWSRYYVVQIASATKDGLAKSYLESVESSVARSVDRKVTSYSFPPAFEHKAAGAFLAQKAGTLGYETKEALKAFLENAFEIA